MIFFWFKFVFHPELYRPFLAPPGVSGRDLTSNSFLIGGKHPVHLLQHLGVQASHTATIPPLSHWQSTASLIL